MKHKADGQVPHSSSTNTNHFRLVQLTLNVALTSVTSKNDIASNQEVPAELNNA
jgi:hypothetical protein